MMPHSVALEKKKCFLSLSVSVYVLLPFVLFRVRTSASFKFVFLHKNTLFEKDYNLYIVLVINSLFVCFHFFFAFAFRRPVRHHHQCCCCCCLWIACIVLPHIFLFFFLFCCNCIKCAVSFFVSLPKLQMT